MIDYSNWDDKPIPSTDSISEEYWQRAAEETFVIQRCRACGEDQFYPRSHCRNCWSDTVEYTEHSGNGLVYSFARNHIPGENGFEDEVPYIVLLVELENIDANPSGRPVRMSSHIIDCPDEAVEIGLPVEVAFEKIQSNPAVHLPVFKPREDVRGMYYE